MSSFGMVHPEPSSLLSGGVFMAPSHSSVPLSLRHKFQPTYEGSKGGGNMRGSPCPRLMEIDFGLENDCSEHTTTHHQLGSELLGLSCILYPLTFLSL